MNTVKKVLLVTLLMGGAAAPAFAQETPVDPVEMAETKIDSVGTVGAKAYTIAAGLALTGVIIGFIRKAKR